MEHWQLINEGLEDIKEKINEVNEWGNRVVNMRAKIEEIYGEKIKEVW